MDVPSDREHFTNTPNLCSFTFLLVYSFTTKNLDLLSMLYKLSYYFFRILQFFNEMLKQKNCVVLFFWCPFYSNRKFFGKETAISTRDHPVCRFFCQSFCLYPLSLQNLNRRRVLSSEAHESLP